MTLDRIITALDYPADARVEQRVPKKMLVENGAPTAADKRAINDGIEELRWHASLKPDTIGVSAYQDEEREYLEIAVLSVTLRAKAKASRIAELVHRAIPYPAFLIRLTSGPPVLSLAHIRWSQGEAGRTVLDGPMVACELPTEPSAFLSSLEIASQPRKDLRAFYQGWVHCLEAQLAAAHTGVFDLPADKGAADRRREALAQLETLNREIAGLRAQAGKERQLNRRVELNLQVKQLESRLAAVNENL